MYKMMKRVLGVAVVVPMAFAAQAADMPAPDATLSIDSTSIAGTGVVWSHGTLVMKNGDEVKFSLTGLNMKSEGATAASITGKVITLPASDQLGGNYRLMPAEPKDGAVPSVATIRLKNEAGTVIELSASDATVLKIDQDLTVDEDGMKITILRTDETDQKD